MALKFEAFRTQLQKKKRALGPRPGLRRVSQNLTPGVQRCCSTAQFLSTPVSNCSTSTSGHLDLSSPIHSVLIPLPPLVWRAGRPGGSAVSSSGAFDSIRGCHGVMDAFLPAEPCNESRSSNLRGCGLRSPAFRSRRHFGALTRDMLVPVR